MMEMEGVKLLTSEVLFCLFQNVTAKHENLCRGHPEATLEGAPCPRSSRLPLELLLSAKRFVSADPSAATLALPTANQLQACSVASSRHPAGDEEDDDDGEGDDDDGGDGVDDGDNGGNDGGDDEDSDGGDGGDDVVDSDGDGVTVVMTVMMVVMMMVVMVAMMVMVMVMVIMMITTATGAHIS
ncbi:Testis-Specific Y-Encoded-Like Protein 2 [Manis pentadactyla]|nr:Testis-Specific Y-Encoded-Like Protein 2 [Manis pentadactyla]